VIQTNAPLVPRHARRLQATLWRASDGAARDPWLQHRYYSSRSTNRNRDMSACKIQTSKQAKENVASFRFTLSMLVERIGKEAKTYAMHLYRVPTIGHDCRHGQTKDDWSIVNECSPLFRVDIYHVLHIHHTQCPYAEVALV
jgi:hypothetical protein